MPKMLNISLYLLISILSLIGIQPAYAIDTDEDGIEDILDRDDDNDGITDMQELCDADWDTSNDATQLKISSVLDLDAHENQSSYEIADPNGKILKSDGGFDNGYCWIAFVGVACTSGSEVIQPSVTINDNGDGSANGTYRYTIFDSDGEWHQGGRNGLSTKNQLGIGFLVVIGDASDHNWKAGYKASWATYNQSGKEIQWTNVVERYDYPNFGSRKDIDIDVHGLGIDGFNCLVGDPHADADGDSLLNYEDADYAVLHGSFLNDKGVMASLDLDSDGVINSMDLDADGDGIPDNVEAQTTRDFNNLLESVNGSGIDIAYGDLGIIPVDTDGDSLPDYKDLNSDGDTDVDHIDILDTAEVNIIITDDINGDGITDSLQASYLDPNGVIDDPTNSLRPDADSLGLVDEDRYFFPDTDQDFDQVDGEGNFTGDVDYRDGAKNPVVRITLTVDVTEDSGAETIGYEHNWPLSFNQLDGGLTGSGVAGDPAITNKAAPPGIYEISVDENFKPEYDFIRTECLINKKVVDFSDGITLEEYNNVTCTFYFDDKDLIAPEVTVRVTSDTINSHNQDTFNLLGECTAGDSDVAVVVEEILAPTNQQSVECTSEGNWQATFNVSDIGDGIDAVSASVSQSDTSGNVGTAEIKLNKDTSLPTLIVSSSHSVVPVAGNIEIIGQAYDAPELTSRLVRVVVGLNQTDSEPVCDIALSSDDWNCQFSVAAIAEEDNNFLIVAIDEAGNRAVQNYLINIDHTAPTATTINAINTPASGNAFLIEGTGEGNSTIELSINGINVCPVSPISVDAITKTWSCSINTTLVVDGEDYQLIAKERDFAGNQNSGIATAIKIDNTASVSTTIDSPTSLEKVKGIITVLGNREDRGVGHVIEVSVKGTDLTLCVKTIAADFGKWTCSVDTTDITESLGDGTHTLLARETDLAGNVNNGSEVVVLVDNTSPDELSLQPIPEFIKDEYEFSGQAEENAKIQIWREDDLLCQSIALSGEWECDVDTRTYSLSDTVNLVQESVEYLFKEIDAHGNENTITKIINIDNLPPSTIIVTPNMSDEGRFASGDIVFSGRDVHVFNDHQVKLTTVLSDGSIYELCHITARSSEALEHESGYSYIDWTCPAFDTTQLPDRKLGDSPYQLSLVSVDVLGNESRIRTYSLYVNNESPEQPIIYNEPLPEYVHSNFNLLLEGTHAHRIEVFEENSDVALCSKSEHSAFGGGQFTCEINTSDYAHGAELTLTIRKTVAYFTDLFSERTVTVTIDRIVPEAPVVDLYPIHPQGVTGNYMFTGQGEVGAEVDFYLASDSTRQTICSDTVADSGTWQCEVDTSLYPDGQLVGFNARQTDKAGLYAGYTSVEVFPFNNNPILNVDPISATAISKDYELKGQVTEWSSIQVSIVGGSTLCVSDIESTVDGTSNWICTIKTVDADDSILLSDGVYALKTVAKNPGGLSTTVISTESLTVDNTPPEHTSINAIAELVSGSLIVSGDRDDAAHAISVVKSDKTSELCSVPIDGSRNWSCDFDTAELGDGEHSIYVTETDTAGNVREVKSNFFIVDNTAPEGPVVSTDIPTYISGDLTLLGTADEGSSISFTLNNVPACSTVASASGEWSSCVVQSINFDDGDYTLTATETDKASNTNSIKFNVTIDNTAPTETTVNPIEGVVRGLQSISGTAETGNSILVKIAEEECSINPVATDIWSCDIDTTQISNTLVSEITYTIEVTETDLAGNTHVVNNVDITIDNAAPVGTTIENIDVPVSGMVTVNGTGAENGNSIIVTKVIAGNDELCTDEVENNIWSCEFDSADKFVDGDHEVQVTESDVAGNKASATTIIEIDNTAPELPIISVTNPVGVHPLIEGQAEANSQIEVTHIDGRPLCSTAATADKAFTCTSNVLLETGAHTINVESCDVAGNCSQATQEINVDDSYPELAVVEQYIGSDNLLKVQALSDVLVKVSGYPETSLLCDGTANSSGDFSCPLATLAEGKHQLLVSTCNSIGNCSPVLADITVDRTFPVSPTVNTNNPAGSLPVVSGFAEPKSKIRVTQQSDSSVLCENIMVEESGVYSCRSTLSISEGVVGITVESCDAAGNCSTTNHDLVVDLTVPVVPTLSGYVNADNRLRGTAEPVTLMTVTDLQSNTPVCSVVVDAQGQFECGVDSFAAGSYVFKAESCNATDCNDISKTVIIDRTAPVIQSIIIPSPSGSLPSVSGESEPGTTVTITTESGQQLCTTIVENDRQFECRSQVALPEGETTITIAICDSAGNCIEETRTVTVDTTTLQVPTIDPYVGADQEFSGSAEINTHLFIRNDSGELLCQTLTSSLGEYRCQSIATLAEGPLNVIVKSCNESAEVNCSSDFASITVDLTAPEHPVMTAPLGITGIRPTFEGNAEAGTEISIKQRPFSNTLCETSVTDLGSFACSSSINLTSGPHDVMIIACDAADNCSTTEVSINVDDAVPSLPSLNNYVNALRVLSGTAEADNTIFIKRQDDSTPLCTTTVLAGGEYNCSAPDILIDGNMSVLVEHCNLLGNCATLSKLVEVDQVLPVLAQIDPYIGQDKIISGQAEADAQVTVRNSVGALLCETVAENNDDFSCTALPALTDGNQDIEVQVCDAAGNCSSNINSIIVDQIKPESPTVSNFVGIDNILRGSSEAGSSVTISLSSGGQLCSVMSDSLGQFECPSNIDLEEGTENIQVLVCDAADNCGSGETIINIDKTAPSTPNSTPTDGSYITGTGDIGTVAIIRNTEGTELCRSDVIGDDGTFHCEIKPIQSNGTALILVLADEAGNETEGVSLNVNGADSDNDGLSDLLESYLSANGGSADTSPSTDTDNDGLPDYIEIRFDSDFLDSNAPIFDGGGDVNLNLIPDGLDHYLQLVTGNNINRFTDSDGDGIRDYIEVTTAFGDPTDANLPSGKVNSASTNGIMTAMAVSNINNAFSDFDQDGYPDWLESREGIGYLTGNKHLGATSLVADDDGDGVPNRIEGLLLFSLDPNESIGSTDDGSLATATQDTDLDGLPDIYEISIDSGMKHNWLNTALYGVSDGTARVASFESALHRTADLTDSDNDQINDVVESFLTKGQSLTSVTASQDSDGDGIADVDEIKHGSNPFMHELPIVWLSAENANATTVRLTAKLKGFSSTVVSLQWTHVDIPAGANTNINGAVAEFSNLAQGSYPIQLIATRTMNIDGQSFTFENRVSYRMLIGADSQLTIVDKDADGVADEKDQFDSSFLAGDDLSIKGLNSTKLQKNPDNTGGNLTSSAGTYLQLGLIGRAAVANGAVISIDQIKQYGNGSGNALTNTDVANDTTHNHITEIYDYDIAGLSEVGAQTSIVIPLDQALPEEAIARKFNATNGWSTFDTSAGDNFYSAQASGGNCPEIGSVDYKIGLTEGDTCVLLSIKDGGLNDADGKANGYISDPITFATLISVVTPIDPGPISAASTSTSAKTNIGGGALGASFIGWLLLMIIALRNRMNIFLAICLGSTAIIANAEVKEWDQGWNIGGALGVSQLAPDSDDLSGGAAEKKFAWQLQAGKHITEWLSAEAFYTDLNQYKFDSASIDYKSYGAHAIAGLPLDDWNVYGLIGMNKLQTKGTNTTVNQENPITTHIGLGATYQWDQYWSNRLEWKSFSKDASLLTLALVYEFGHSGNHKSDYASETVSDLPQMGHLDEVETQLLKEEKALAQSGSKVVYNQFGEPVANGDQSIQQELETATQVEAALVVRPEDEETTINRIAPLATRQLPKVMSNVYYPVDKHGLNPAARIYLTKVAQVLKQRKEVIVGVYGYTDSTGTKEYNDALSLRRVESVRRFLAAKGIFTDRMRLRGLGEAAPIGDNSTAEGRARNRRVELVVEK